MSRIDSKNVDVKRPRVGVRNASWATIAVFVLNGFFFASWVSRIPTVRDQLDIGPGTIGVILLVGSAGSVASLPLAGAVVIRLGTARTVACAAALAALGMIAVAASVLAGSVVLIALSLALANVGIAGWDVAMNLEGAMVEQGLGRAIMPIYHAGFSVGAVLGAAAGALVSRHGVAVALHLIVMAAAVALTVAVAVRWFLAEQHGTPHAETPTARTGADASSVQDAVTGQDAERQPVRRSPFAAWLEPRTLLIGLLVLSAALTEGAANDWLSLASIEAFDLTNSDGALVLTVFLAAMTVMRFVGTSFLDRFGRVLVLRICIALAVVGLLVFALSPSLPLAVAGAVLWGLGAALGFPVGMSAASDDPSRAAARVSVVSSIGYTAFLAGPPLLGLLAEHVGYRQSLLVIVVPLVISLFITRVAAPPAGSVGSLSDRADAVNA